MGLKHSLRILLCACSLLFSSSGISQTIDFSAFEKVLIPAPLGRTPGINGTLWEGRLVIFNGSDRGAVFFPTGGCITGTDVCVLPRTFEIEPGKSTVAQMYFDRPEKVPIQFLYVQKTAFKNIHFRFRIRELTKGLPASGTDVPVIRINDTLTGPAELLEVPLGSAAARITLRIYDFESIETRRFTLRIFPSNGSTEPLLSTEVSTLLPRSITEPRISPGMIQLQNLFFDARLAGHEHVRVEIEPQSPQPFWTYITITDNESQDVLLITPQ